MPSSCTPTSCMSTLYEPMQRTATSCTTTLLCKVTPCTPIHAHHVHAHSVSAHDKHAHTWNTTSEKPEARQANRVLKKDCQFSRWSNRISGTAANGTIQLPVRFRFPLPLSLPLPLPFLHPPLFPCTATTPYFYGSILLRALKSKIIVLLTNVYEK